MYSTYQVLINLICIGINIIIIIKIKSLLPSGQLSNTVCAISPAESVGLNRNSFVLPLTSIKRKFI